jgi:hypothetical protein
MVKGLLVAALLVSQSAAPIFRYETDGFWLNLHHFLYVLGRVEANMPDIRRDAVVGAPADQAEGFKSLSEADQQTWREAVSFYARGLSKQDVVFDEHVIAITNQLKRAAADTPASSLKIDPEVAAALDRAAPVYRRAWWTKHRDANRAWVASQQELLKRYGPQVLAYITGKYQEAWMDGGYPINVSAWNNWAGAYSTSFSLLVISSLAKGNAGDQGFEITFHEAMHQWDDAIRRRFAAVAAANRVPSVKGNLTHAMIFYTAGEAVRSVVPGHARYADVAGVWDRGMAQQKVLLDAHWKPYLDGKTTLDEALLALLKAQ